MSLKLNKTYCSPLAIQVLNVFRTRQQRQKWLQIVSIFLIFYYINIRIPQGHSTINKIIAALRSRIITIYYNIKTYIRIELMISTMAFKNKFNFNAAPLFVGSE